MPGIHTVTIGRSDGPTLLLVHPLGARREFWDACIALWSDNYRIVACDLRGAGRSPRADGVWRVDDHVRDLQAVREQVGGPVIPIGCAIGSLITARYAATDRAHVLGLVLCDTTPGLDEISRKRTQARVDNVLQQGIGVLLPEVVDMAFEGQPRDERYQDYLRMFAANDPQGYAAIAVGMMGTDNRAALASLTCPALVLAGVHDRLLPPELSRAAHELIAGSEFGLIESAAHFPPYQNPAEFSARVTEFIERRVLPV